MLNELFHIGTPQLGYNSPTGSGRYRKGTGDNPYQHETSLYSTIREMEKRGLSEKEIADLMGYTVRELRAKKSYSRAQEKELEYAYIRELADQGYSHVAIGEKIGKDEAYVRYRLKATVAENNQSINNTADVIRECFDRTDYIDVGPGTANLLGVSKTKLDTAIQQLVDEGYELHTDVRIPQAANPGQYTTMSVLTPPGHDQKDIYRNREEIQPVIGKYSEDNGKTFLGIEYPASVDSSRIKIIYAEDGGTEKDGVIELRRGVPDLSLGGANYAQVRIAVDDSHFMKGMAIYRDDMPPGVDILFNTNKHVGTPMMSSDPDAKQVLKPFKVNKKTGEIENDNPFGTTLRMEEGVIVGQHHYKDENGEDKLSPINIVRQEGDWNRWSKTLSAQFLSKQPKELIKQQLNMTYKDMEDQYKEIISIPQNEVRAKLLDDFAEECDKAAVHLKAVGLPRQASKVILPLTEISDDEVYAPTFKEGEKVALVRYPHGGTFEIPILTVNNHLPEGNRVITKKSIDAIGISPRVAERLSGADFDGDTVTVIPTIGQHIKSTPALKGLINFNPKEEYPKVDGMKVMSKKNTQTEMGKISNLITDMTLKGANEDEVTRAVKHSMVVIDAEKHKLNYKLSEEVNGIKELKEKYQGKYNAGASTLISRSKAQTRIDARNNYITDPETGKRQYINPETGEKLYSPSGATRSVAIKDKDGNTVGYKYVKRQEVVERLRLYSDANDPRINSGTWQEKLYGDYSNKLKALANKSRLDAYNTESSKVNQKAKQLYSEEVKSLNNKLNTALLNKPYERAAQIYASVYYSAAKKDNPDMSYDEAKKIKTQALSAGRNKVGAKKEQITFTDKEWQAIESGALSSSKLKSILDNCDMDYVKKVSLPRESNEISAATQTRIRNYADRGYSLNDISDALGISVTTVSKYVGGEE